MLELFIGSLAVLVLAAAVIAKLTAAQRVAPRSGTITKASRTQHRA